jgi:hypothetical protein
MNARPGYAVLGLALLLGKTASAEPSASHAFRLAYDAPTGCPGAESVAAAIQSSSAKAHPAADAEPAIDLLAFVTVTEGGFLGVLRIRRPDGTETTRGVPAATCAEAAQAMTLIAAIAVDPDAAVAAPGTTSNPGDLDGGATPGAASTESVDKEPTPAEPEPKPAERKASNQRPVRASSRKRDRPWQLGATAGVGIIGAMAPTLSPDFALGLGAGTTSRTLVSPWVRLSAHLAESAAVNSADGNGTARFERLAGRLTGCPLMGQMGLAASPVVLRPCLLFEAGRLRASGSNAPNHKDVSLGWTALGATLRGELVLFGPLTLGLEAGALFPLLRDSFYFDPDRQNVVHQVERAGFLGSLELGLRIL